MTKNKMYNYLPHPIVSGTFAISFIFYYFNAPLLFSFPDVPWHISAGELILKSGSIPKTDPWSYTAQGYDWYNISWLWDCIISFIADKFTLEGLYFFVISTYSLLLSVLSWYLLKNKNIKEGPACAIVFVTLMVLWPFISARPQIASYFMVLVFIIILDKSRSNQKFSTLLLLPALTALWVNLHGGFLTAFILIGAYFLEAYAHKNTKWLKQLVVIGILCAIASLINPYGWEIAIAVSRTLGNIMTQYISEWRPISFGDKFGPSLCIAVFLLTSNIRDKDTPVANKILTFFWLFSALLSIRNIPIFTLVAASYMAVNLSKLGKPQPFPDLSAPLLKIRFSALTAMVIIFMAIPQVRQLALPRSVVNDPEKVPVGAIEYIQTNYPSETFYNDYQFGGYLIFHGNNKIKVFADGRAGTAYPDHVLKEVITVLGLENGWKDVFNNYGINGIIVNNKHPLSKEFEKGALENWNLVYQDDVSNVFFKNPI